MYRAIFDIGYVLFICLVIVGIIVVGYNMLTSQTPETKKVVPEPDSSGVDTTLVNINDLPKADQDSLMSWLSKAFLQSLEES